MNLIFDGELIIRVSSKFWIGDPLKRTKINNKRGNMFWWRNQIVHLKLFLNVKKNKKMNKYGF